MGAAGLGLIIAGVAAGFPDWGFVAIAVGLAMAMGIGYGIVTQTWIATLCIALVALAAGMIVAGAIQARTWSDPFVAGGILGMIVIGASIMVVHFVKHAPPPAASPHTHESAHLSSVDRAEMQRLAHQVHELHQMLCLSEDARRALYGDRDREILRASVQSRIDAGDYDGARHLCETIEEVCRDRDDAEEFRALIEGAMQRHRDHDLEDMLVSFEAALHHRDWPAANDVAERLRTIAPEAPAVSSLSERIAGARDHHKQDLESQLLEASQRDDVEAAMRILKALDRYMTREEAERLSEEAQSIIARHRERLSSAFQDALKHKRWTEAARAGNQIIAEYPNTKMAQEVRSLIAVIRNRATQQALTAEAE